jgi:phosphotransferase system HPr-like phosphotransfer protein
MQLRKIETKKEQERRQRRNELIVGIFFIVIMILSTIGYSIDREKEEKVVFNNIKFIKTAQGWKADNGLLTRFLPKQVSNISTNILITADYFNGKKIYFSAQSYNELEAANEILRNIKIEKWQLACLEGEENKTGCENLPIKNCKENDIIVLREQKNETEEKTKIYRDERCIFIEAGSEELIKAADRFIFTIYKIL